MNIIISLKVISQKDKYRLSSRQNHEPLGINQEVKQIVWEWQDVGKDGGEGEKCSEVQGLGSCHWLAVGPWTNYYLVGSLIYTDWPQILNERIRLSDLLKKIPSLLLLCDFGQVT